MTEKRLNNCLLLYVHKELTDSLDLLKIGKEFINNEEVENILASLSKTVLLLPTCMLLLLFVIVHTVKLRI